MTGTEQQSRSARHDGAQNVAILMSDMAQYSQQTSSMCPETLRDFIIDYHYKLVDLVDTPDNNPVDIEPSGGDGSLIIFKKRFGEDDRAICTRAVQTAINIANAIETGNIQPTRMGLYLGRIVEAEICGKMAKFSTCFAVANRLEELCGHFGTILLMDREVARNQDEDQQYLVSIGKFSLTSVLHPMNAYTIYKPGIHNIPKDVNEQQLLHFIRMKNEAMELFSGNLLKGILPDFPTVREQLIDAQSFFVEMTGKEDLAIARILEYIRETPYPAGDFNSRGMLLMEKKRDSIGDRLVHLSGKLLKAMNHDIYHALIVDTAWEQCFKLEWHSKGSTIIKIGDTPDGIYYLDTGTAKTYNSDNKLLSVMEDGDIFGEMAYFGSELKRTATVVADSDVVVRKISTDDFSRLPVIIEIFKRIAEERRKALELRNGKNADKNHTTQKSLKGEL
ncbi:cyclic nucleotide-binding domain-containing protein [Desulfopila aestuarii]|uniref:Adenylate and Guanylate cyclase catalytic domain-containing protein n=1 Tax=Desulfopila aestuarii DSM 18488 TaxID=1121416 RepID=A0A1M7YFE0_9BACT|nr:cyclic nucleotide-binding domain-containing protein [Desulfopila aestuarii]SHO51340.1 Adenylate and Guanylate cyclase catalytic domain-containing protein [Desulfopila aestuarii DSM 18488]